jgi:hypothetical protein
MLVARLADGSRRGIPAWIFDPSVCNEVRKLSQPVVETRALLEIAHLLELNGQRKITARDERNSNNETETGFQNTGHPNTPSLGRGHPTGEENTRSQKSRVRDAVKATDRGGRNAEHGKPRRRAQ